MMSSAFKRFCPMAMYEVVAAASLKTIVFVAFLYGAYEHFGPKRNMCAMTYMYQIPEYIPIALDKETRQAFPVYKLYSYGEGLYANRLRSKRYDGIPVLFLPGNSGSYKQVRSLASVSITKAESDQNPFHFNYFAVDFNEELSALYGDFLFKHTEFTAICIDVILRLYDQRTPTRPRSVIIVGHSMGGMIARAVLMLEDFDSRTIQLIVTLATPHSKPVFTPDSHVHNFYLNVNRYWNRERNSTLRHVNVVSIGGGLEDRMVRSDLTNSAAGQEFASSRDINIMSNAIPGVWLGMDHLCIVWCNQLVLAIVRTTFKLIAAETRQLILDSVRRHWILTMFLVDGAHIRSHPLRLAANWVVPMSYENLWTSRRAERWEYRGDGDAAALLINTPKANQHLFIATLNLNLKPWIFTCTRDGDQCNVTGVPVCRTLHLPSASGARKVFHCSEMDSKYLVIKLPSNDAGKALEVFAEIFYPTDRTFHMSWPELLVGVDIAMPKYSLFNTATLTGFSETWEAYRVKLRASGSSCKGAVVHLSVPWSVEDTFESIDSLEGERSLVLHSPRPLHYSSADHGPEIRFYLNPKCAYTITVKFSLFDALSQVVRFYIYTCPAFVAAAALNTLSSQLAAKPSEERTMSVPLFTLIKSLAKAYTVTAMLDRTFGMLDDAASLQHGLLSDLYKRWWSVPILLFVYIAASVAVSVCLIFIRIVVLVTKKCRQMLPRRSAADNDGTTRKTATWTPSMFTVALLVFVLAIGHYVCGAMAIFFTVIILILKAKVSTLNGDLHVVYLIWGLIFLFACPTLVVRMKNFRIGQFKVDPSLIQSYFMAIMLLGRKLSIEDLRKPRKSVSADLTGLQSLLAIGILVFGIEHMHRIPWFLIANCLLLLFWPVIAKIRSTSTDHQQHED